MFISGDGYNGYFSLHLLSLSLSRYLMITLPVHSTSGRSPHLSFSHITEVGFLLTQSLEQHLFHKISQYFDRVSPFHLLILQSCFFIFFLLHLSLSHSHQSNTFIFLSLFSHIYFLPFSFKLDHISSDRSLEPLLSHPFIHLQSMSLATHFSINYSWFTFFFLFIYHCEFFFCQNILLMSHVMCVVKVTFIIDSFFCVFIFFPSSLFSQLIFLFTMHTCSLV